MFRPQYKIYCGGELGTDFKDHQILDPIKKFLTLNDIPESIVKERGSGSPNDMIVMLFPGSFETYGEKINAAFSQLGTTSYSFSCRGDMLYFWAPCLEDVVEYINIHEHNEREKLRRDRGHPNF